MKNSKNVSINNVSHNCDYVRNPQRYTLKCYSWCSYGGFLSDFFTTNGISEEFTRYQIFCQLKSYFAFGSRVSFSKSFFSPFNSDPVFNKYCADLSYFYDKLPIAKDYVPVAIERYDDKIDYIIAIPVKDESKL